MLPHRRNIATSTTKLVTAIRTTAQELHEYRSAQMEKKQWGITKLYNEYFYDRSLGTTSGVSVV